MNKKLLRKAISLSIVLYIVFGEGILSTLTGIRTPVGLILSLFSPVLSPVGEFGKGILFLLCGSPGWDAFGCAIIFAPLLFLLMIAAIVIPLYILIDKFLEIFIK